MTRQERKLIDAAKQYKWAHLKADEFKRTNPEPWHLGQATLFRQVRIECTTALAGLISAAMLINLDNK